ncbi:hypothetical protein HZA99_03150, partial [Candidatus Woesearchaeota archaeon]|nr:hypothetical protein [Candidatus Woesearchaeota archaeon]
DVVNPTIKAGIVGEEQHKIDGNNEYMFKVGEQVVIKYSATDNKEVTKITGYISKDEKRISTDENLLIPEKSGILRTPEERTYTIDPKKISAPGTYKIELVAYDKANNTNIATIDNIIIQAADNGSGGSNTPPAELTMANSPPADALTPFPEINNDLVVCATLENKTAIRDGSSFYEMQQDKNEADKTKLAVCNGMIQSFPQHVPVYLSQIDVEMTEERQTKTGDKNLFVLRKTEKKGLVNLGNIVTPEITTVSYCLTKTSAPDRNGLVDVDCNADKNWTISHDDKNGKQIPWAYKGYPIEIKVHNTR